MRSGHKPSQGRPVEREAIKVPTSSALLAVRHEPAVDIGRAKRRQHSPSSECVEHRKLILRSKSLLQLGDFTPGYQSVQEAPVHAGSAVTRIQLTAASGWQIDLLAVQAAIRPSTKYIVVNLPHNPSGTLLSREAQAQLTAIAEPRGIYIMSDEVSHSTA